MDIQLPSFFSFFFFYQGQKYAAKCSRRLAARSLRRQGPETALGQEQARHHNCGGGGWRDENTKLHEEAGEEVRFFW